MTSSSEASELSTSVWDVRVRLNGHITRSISDDYWQSIDAEHIACWKDATTLLGLRALQSNGATISLAANWSPVVRRIKHNTGIQQKLEGLERGAEYFSLLRKFKMSPVDIDVAVSMDRPAEPGDLLMSREYVEYFLSDMFIMLNLSSPASFTLYAAKIITGQKFDSPINISNYFFDSVSLRSYSGIWPRLKSIPLSDVVSWYERVRPTVRMSPATRMEKVIFAILHLSDGNVSPVTIVWIFYALETLFDTSPGENLRIIIRRISLLLSPNQKEAAYLRKQMRELYNIRSAFVHGGLDVIHPLHNELLDKSVDAMWSKLMEAADFGFHILVASVQEAVRRGWEEIAFKETLFAGQSESQD